MQMKSLILQIKKLSQFVSLTELKVTTKHSDNLDIPNWVEGAGQRSSSRKLNRLRLATKLVMAAAHDKKQKPPSASRKSINR